jgi:hypothetical protein
MIILMLLNVACTKTNQSIANLYFPIYSFLGIPVRALQRKAFLLFIAEEDC